ncbi:MAG: aldehyde dehydrogenase family protein [Thermoplasmata archaeon]|nr:aldehyde dehydrogenase family protein [Thermoplasmata archaeon]MCI4356566.1 aldehyde dehydrogenase family protein [Thermoplasmata archaeon]
MATVRTVGPLIDNESLPAKGRSTFDVIDPSNGKLVGRVAAASADDARAAMDSARDAQPAWEALGAHARGKYLIAAAERLRARRDELALLLTQEMGKVAFEARSEVDGAIDNLEYYASHGRTLHGDDVAGLPTGDSLRLIWRPRGVVVGITPWNFPAATVTRKIGPAIVIGNTMVLKPSSATPLSSVMIGEAFRSAGLPPGVLNVVPGPGGSIGPALIQHPACSTVTLTGSTESGVEILKLAASGVTKCLLELGGKAPVIVAQDADLDWAARATVWARFWNNGQSCIAAERCYVHREVRSRFVERVRALTEQLVVGPPLRGTTDIGPLYSAGARDKIEKDVATGLAGGAKLLLGGERPKAKELASGAYWSPTILVDVADDNPTAREELFGPVLPILEYEDFDDVIRRANASVYGLSSYLFTRSGALAEKAARELQFGETYINRVGPETPQGYHAGFRQSGLGGEGSRWGLYDYMQLKSVYVDWREPHSSDYFLPYHDRRAPNSS